MSSRDPIAYEIADVLKETDRAILVELVDGKEERWIPKSVIHDDSEVWDLESFKNGGTTLCVQRWFAAKEWGEG